MRIDINNNNSFQGLFQGVIIEGTKVSKMPKVPVMSCPYADRMMMKTLSKIVSSKKYSSNLQLNLKELPGDKSIQFSVQRNTVKRFLPKLAILTKGDLFKLENKTFWKLLKKKHVDIIDYEISQKNIEKMIKYFLTPPAHPKACVIQSEDEKIFKKVLRFKEAFLKNYGNQKLNIWLNDMIPPNLDNIKVRSYV